MARSAEIARSTHRIAWLDALRVVGALLIFFYHFGADYELTFGDPSAASAVAAAFSAVRPDFAKWAISLFVMLAGLSLTLTWRATETAIPYFMRRAARLLLPLWIVAIPYTLMAVLLGLLPVGDLWKVPFWLLGLGIVSFQTYLPVPEAWWYVTLALQCALIMPAVMWLLRRTGTGWTVCALAAIEVMCVWSINQAPAEWHYLVQGLILARLVEFGAGLLVAQILLKHLSPLRAVALSLPLAAGALIGDRLGAITPVQVVIFWMAVLLALCLSLGSGPPSSRYLTSAGLATYPFYLAHAPIGKYTIRVLSGVGLDSWLVLASVALALSTLVAFLVMFVQGRVTRVLPRSLR